MQNQRTSQSITRTPAPFLPGYYSVQAVSDKPGVPDITVYRYDMDSALEAKNSLRKVGVFSRFLVRSAESVWDVYGADGNLEQLCSDVVYDHISEYPKEVMVNRERFDAQVGDVIGGGASCLTCVECHAGSGSVEHSNFVVLSRVLVMKASPKDLQHFYVAESHEYPCRLVGLYGKLALMSEPMVNEYLDRYEWLSVGWPLSNPHYAGVLAKRLAQVRSRYLGDLISGAMSAKGLGEEEALHARFVIEMSPAEAKRRFADKVVETLMPGLEITQPGAPELFAEEVVEANYGMLLKHYRETVGIS